MRDEEIHWLTVGVGERLCLGCSVRFTTEEEHDFPGCHKKAQEQQPQFPPLRTFPPERTVPAEPLRGESVLEKWLKE